MAVDIIGATNIDGSGNVVADLQDMVKQTIRANGVPVTRASVFNFIGGTTVMNPKTGAVDITFPTSSQGGSGLYMLDPMAAPYNAKGDNSTDDRAAIQACATDCVSQNLPMYVRPGHIFYCNMTIANPSIAVNGDFSVIGFDKVNSGFRFGPEKPQYGLNYSGFEQKSASGKAMRFQGVNIIGPNAPGPYTVIYNCGNGTLSANINNAVTSLTTTAPNTFQMPAPFVIIIDTEQIKVGAFNSTTGVMSSLTRGYNGSTAASHTAGAVTTLYNKSTLASNYTANSTTMVVADSLPFPTTTTGFAFQVQVDSEIFLVTGVSGNTLTVVPGYRGTTPANHSSGAVIQGQNNNNELGNGQSQRDNQAIYGILIPPQTSAGCTLTLIDAQVTGSWAEGIYIQGGTGTAGVKAEFRESYATGSNEGMLFFQGAGITDARLTVYNSKFEGGTHDYNPSPVNGGGGFYGHNVYYHPHISTWTFGATSGTCLGNTGWHHNSAGGINQSRGQFNMHIGFLNDTLSGPVWTSDQMPTHFSGGDFIGGAVLVRQPGSYTNCQFRGAFTSFTSNEQSGDVTIGSGCSFWPSNPGVGVSGVSLGHKVGNTWKLQGGKAMLTPPYPFWTANNQNAKGDFCIVKQASEYATNSSYFQCTSATGSRFSGGSEPTWNTTVGGTTTDNDLVWTCLGTLDTYTQFLATLSTCTGEVIIEDWDFYAMYNQFNRPQYYITLDGSPTVYIRRCRFNMGSSGPYYGSAIYLTSTFTGTVIVENNELIGASGNLVEDGKASGAAVVFGQNNVLGSGTLKTAGRPMCVQPRNAFNQTSVASAGNVTLSSDYNQVHVTGTTAINNLYVSSSAATPCFAGTYSLILDAACSFTNAGNIKATAGARTANDMVTFLYDPVAGYWYEVK